MRIQPVERFLFWARKHPPLTLEVLSLSGTLSFGLFLLSFGAWPVFDFSSLFLYGIWFHAFAAGFMLSANLGERSFVYFLALSMMLGLLVCVMLHLFFSHFVHYSVYMFCLLHTLWCFLLGVGTLSMIRYAVFHVAQADILSASLGKVTVQVVVPVLTGLIVYFFTGQLPS